MSEDDLNIVKVKTFRSRFISLPGLDAINSDLKQAKSDYLNTSKAISFKDPVTGTTIIQTQILQVSIVVGFLPLPKLVHVLSNRMMSKTYENFKIHEFVSQNSTQLVKNCFNPLMLISFIVSDFKRFS
jgi:hypothetical protein